MTAWNPTKPGDMKVIVYQIKVGIWIERQNAGGKIIIIPRFAWQKVVIYSVYYVQLKY